MVSAWTCLRCCNVIIHPKIQPWFSQLWGNWLSQAGFVSSVGKGDCRGSPLHRLLARVGLGAGSTVLELAGGSFTFPGFMNRFLSRLLFWTSPALESFHGCWSWSRKEPRNSCHCSLGCAFGTLLLFPACWVFPYFIWLNKRILIVLPVHGVGRGKTML